MVLVIPVFITLGMWQLDRAEEKSKRAALQLTRAQMPPLKITIDSSHFKAVEFRKLSVTGRLRTDKQVLIENRKHKGKSGFHVITPIQIGNSDQYMLINQGWIARKTEQIMQQNESITITGKAVIPQPPALVLDESIPDAQESVWPFVTLEKFRAWSGLKLVPYLLLQSPKDNSGYVRQWPKQQFRDGMHIGYAIQWFAFALIAVATWLGLSIQRTAIPEANS